MISSKINIEQLTDLLSASGHGPRVYYQPLPPGQWAERLWRAGQNQDADLIPVFNGNHLSALASIRMLDWDTRFFGFPCALIDGLAARGGTMERYTAAREAVGRVLDLCRTKGVRFLSTKLPGPDPALVQALENHGFYTTNINLCLSRTGQAPHGHPLPHGFHFSNDIQDPSNVASAFRHLFYDGRFHNDPRIEAETADRLWEAAILNQLENEASHMLFVQKEDRTAGLATVKSIDPDGETGSLFIFGVDPVFRGLGLGKALLAELLNRLGGRFHRIDVETSTFNLPAIMMYRRCGFQAGGAKAALHWWQNEDR